MIQISPRCTACGSRFKTCWSICLPGRFEQHIGQPASSGEHSAEVFMENEQGQLAVLRIAAQFLNDGPVPRPGIFQVPCQGNRFSMLEAQFNIFNGPQPARVEAVLLTDVLDRPGPASLLLESHNRTGWAPSGSTSLAEA